MATTNTSLLLQSDGGCTEKNKYLDEHLSDILVITYELHSSKASDLHPGPSQ